MAGGHVRVPVAMVGAWVLVYYFASSIGSIANKVVVHDMRVSPTFLAAAQGVVSLVLDFVAVFLLAPSTKAGDRDGPWWRQGRLVAFGRTAHLVDAGKELGPTLVALLPVAGCVLMGRVTTLMSYQTVSVALAHAAKALEPAINVLLSAVFFREIQPLAVNAALVPVVAGVFMASYGESSYSHYGFFLAALSAAFRVVEKIYVKRVMSGRTLGFFQLHLLVGIPITVALILMAAIEALTAANPVFAGAERSHHESWRVAVSIVLGACIVYTSSIASYVILTMMTHLSFTVANTMKRLATMTASIAFFGSTASLTNISGMGVAVGGVLAYNLARARSKAKGAVTERKDPGEVAGEVAGDEELGLRDEDADADDETRAKHDSTYEQDLARTISTA